eukprot:GEMP01142430.1.p1 GENE.GEMP01142430.1~~GEMP01142430.1.p1  ORF type:complete len:122 (-),score=9.51 GEMP01142430.1:24-389(-)
MPLNRHGSKKKRTGHANWTWLYESAECWADSNGYGVSDMLECSAAAAQWVEWEYGGDPKLMPGCNIEAKRLLWRHLDRVFDAQMFHSAILGISRRDPELEEKWTLGRYLRFRPPEKENCPL